MGSSGEFREKKAEKKGSDPFATHPWRRKLRKQQPCAGGFLELIPGSMQIGTEPLFFSASSRAT